MKKNLGLFSTFSIATGAMISSGLFVLPAIIYKDMGSYTILAYLLAAIFMIPALLAKSELATAMPKSGGSFFYVQRGLGPFFATFTGLSDWLSLSLKCAFALLGAGLLCTLFFPAMTYGHAQLIAVILTILFGALNLLGSKESSLFQNILVALLIGILTIFIVGSSSSFTMVTFSDTPNPGIKALLASAAMVFVSFGGLTKITSVAEEIQNPKQNIPRAMIISLVVVTILYILTITMGISVLPANDFIASAAPISLAASKVLGNVGKFAVSLAAMFAFLTTANAGIMAASRTPMAMARDGLMPGLLGRVHKTRETPVNAIIFTVLFMIFVLLTLDLKNLVKTASTLMLILFALDNLSLIVMRESKVVTYRPGFRIPLYPWLPTAGIFLYGYLIIDMGEIPLLITLAFFFLSSSWYFLYGHKHSKTDIALYRILERVINNQLKDVALEDELAEIIRQRDEIISDRVDQVFEQALIYQSQKKGEDILQPVSELISKKSAIPAETIKAQILQREEQSSTLILPDVAVPHIIVDKENMFELVIVRSRDGMKIGINEDVKLAFVLLGSKDMRDLHLKTLVAISQILQSEGFMKSLESADTDNEIQQVIRLAKRHYHQQAEPYKK